MSQAGKFVAGHWSWVARISRYSRAARPDLILRLGYLVTISALMLVIATIGGAGRQQPGVNGLVPVLPSVSGPGQLDVGEPGLPLSSPGSNLVTPGTSPPPEPVAAEKPSPPAPEPQPETKTFPKPLRQVPEAGRRVALTFDDGPFPQWTERYLAVLAATGTRATFFMVGRQAETYPELVRAVMEGGHEIASHSWRHANLGKVTRAEAETDLRQAAAVLEKISEQQVKYFRPPYGAMGAELLAAAAGLGTPAVTWSVDPRDWSNPGPGVIVRHVLANVRDGSIILLHEGHPGTLAALPLLIKGLQEKGYELVTISGLIAGDEKTGAGAGVEILVEK
ncbi:polysaccharide deacetylase family protein [Moorella sulfitireducens (nom. illeg.)]|uniref:polysaccharide deacetylase family protein n=1 Tax=Neomoorella sulfitireducens TaxID=2972948 RepID=UPI0021ABAA53|nr:polysaccharide deacetylase family protein [Moorella sulfitireducens]